MLTSGLASLLCVIVSAAITADGQFPEPHTMTSADHDRAKVQRHQQQLLQSHPRFRGGRTSADWAAAAPHPTCPPSNWTASCPSMRGRMSVAKMPERSPYLTWGPYTSSRWGNVLSPYWQARAMAYLGGLPFDSYSGLSTYWFKHLPIKAPASSCPDHAKWAAACSMCDGMWWEFAHACIGGWTEIPHLIQAETQVAVHTWAKDHNVTLPTFRPDDVVIQWRCSKDSLLGGDDYGPSGFTFYRNAPQTTKRFIFVREDALEHSCVCIQVALEKMLKVHYPLATSEIWSGDIFMDFARVMLAPTLFRYSTSSFSLWAGLGGTGQVWSSPLRLKQPVGSPGANATPQLGARWHWSPAPVLYKEVALASKVAFDTVNPANGDTCWTVRSMLTWLEAN